MVIVLVFGALTIGAMVLYMIRKKKKPPQTHGDVRPKPTIDVESYRQSNARHRDLVQWHFDKP